MTTVGNEVWWRRTESTTILSLDFSGTVLGSIDGELLNLCPTGGMVTIGDEVWRGPNEECVLGGALLRFDLAGNWLGSESEPSPGLLPVPDEGEGTAAMTRVGGEVWWVPEARVGITVPPAHRMDASGAALGTLSLGGNHLPFRRGMATVLDPAAVPSMHPIAL